MPAHTPPRLEHQTVPVRADINFVVRLELAGQQFRGMRVEQVLLDGAFERAR